LAEHRIAEFPFAPRQLALDITSNHIMPDKDGLIRLPDAPGLGMSVNPPALRPYLRDVEIAVAGKTLFRSAYLPAVA
jgi:L-alanine-DL-glutamate epimerase-like enolase superfamily enzyme